MVGFVVKRVALGGVVLAALSVASFCFFASRTDPFRTHPLLPQYWTWLKGVGTGRSLHPLPGQSIADALGHTAALLLGTLVVVVLLSVATASAAARWRGSAADLLLRALSYVAWGLPAFLLAFLIQEGVSIASTSRGLGPFPLTGWPGFCPAGIGFNAGTINPCPAEMRQIKSNINAPTSSGSSQSSFNLQRPASVGQEKNCSSGSSTN